jgi:ribosomal RNA-processing protein 12
LLAQDAAAWEMSVAQVGPRRAVGGLLSYSLDPRPKVRKRAQEALRNILNNPPPSPSLDHPAAPMCAETAMMSLKAVAEKVAALKKEKKGSEAAKDPELIHALQLVKTVASASGGWPSKNIESLCELLLNIARSGNDHMSMAVFEIFEMIFEGMVDEVSSAKLPRLLEIIKELRPAPNDTQLLPPWIAILSRAYDVSAQTTPDETFQELLGPFNMVAGYFESEAKNIRISASECLVSFMANCVPHQVLVDPSIYDEKVIQQLVNTVEGLLTVKFQAAWLETFNVIGAMFDALRWRAAPYLLGITKSIGEMRGNDSFSGKQEADEVLGKAIRAMGPEAVLGVLPLNLAKPVKGQPGRAWMLPLLRDYTSNTNLAHFKTEFVPLSAAMFQRVLDHGDAPKTMEIKIFETVVQQIWSILPGYCDLPLDLVEAFDTEFAEMLTSLVYEQVELRLDVCRALKALVETNQAVATATEEEELALQSRVSKETAQKNLEYLGNTFAADFLAVLFNVYSTTMPQKRGPVLQTINSYLSIIPPARLTETFDLVCEKLALALQEPPEKPRNPNQEQIPSTAHTLMDLVVTMSIYLPRESFEALFKIASLVIFKDDDPQLQKKAYKLIPRLADSDIGKAALELRHEELQTLLLSSAEKVSQPARRERLAAIAALLPFIPDTSLHFIPSILSEVVINCKEHNEKGRTTAFDLLVLMGHKLIAADGAMIDNSKAPHMPKDAPMVPASIEEYVTMVSAGLAGSTPHMISASITAITRVLYEFREMLSPATMADLVQTMDLFLTSSNREIVKSVLGFVKVCIISFPTDMMLPRLATLIPNVMVWSHEHKGHFRAKVKHILERMIRRFGVDIVNKHCPEEDRKLITNIRKTKERSKRKKDAAREGGGDGSDDEETGKRKSRFESEYDQALYSSDDDEGNGSDNSHSDDSDAEMTGRKQNKRKAQKAGGSAYILEDEDEPLDLLDRNALANISTTKPGKLRTQVGRKTKAKTDMDGKLILGGDDDQMDIDTPAAGGEEDSGVGAYVAALKGKDVPRRGLGGKLKWNRNRKNGEDDDDSGGEDGMEVDEGAAAKAFRDNKRGSDRRRGGGGEGRGRGGGEGRGRGGFGRGGGGRGGGGRGGGRGGKGGIAAAAGRRGLGQERQRGPATHGSRVSKGGNRR